MKQDQLFKFEFQDQVYTGKTIQEVSEITGEKQSSLQYRMNQGMSMQDAIDYQSANFEVERFDFIWDGNYYKNKTIKQVSEIVQFDKDKLESHKKNLQKYLDSLYTYDFRGNHFINDSLRNISVVTNTKLADLEKYLKDGKTITEALKDKSYLNNRESYEFYYEGKNYKVKSVPEVSKITGIPTHNLYNRLSIMGIQEAVNKPYTQRNQYSFFYIGERYEDKTLSQISEITGMDPELLRYRLNKMTIQEAVDMGNSKKLYSFNYLGQNYRDVPVEKIASLFAMKVSYVRNYLKKHSIKRLVNSQEFKMHQGNTPKKTVPNKNKNSKNNNRNRKTYSFNYMGQQYNDLTLEEIGKLVGKTYQSVKYQIDHKGFDQMLSFYEEKNGYKTEVAESEIVPSKDEVEVTDTETTQTELQIPDDNQSQEESTENTESIQQEPVEDFLSFNGRQFKFKDLNELEEIVLDLKKEQSGYEFTFEGINYKLLTLEEVSNVTGINLNKLQTLLMIENKSLNDIIQDLFIVGSNGKYHKIQDVALEFNMPISKIEQLKNLGFTYEDFS